LAGRLNSLLAPYMSGQGAPAGQNPMAQLTPALMQSLGQYLGTIPKGVVNQATASGMAPLGSAGTVDWGQLGQALQGFGQPGTRQQTGGSLLGALTGYLGSLPASAGTTGTTGTGGTTTGVGIGPGYAQNMGFDPMTGQWFNPQTGTALTQAPTSGINPLGFYEASSAQGTPQMYFQNPQQQQQYANIMAAEQPYSLANQQTIGGLGMTSTPWSGGGQAMQLTPAQIQYIQSRQAGAGMGPTTLAAAPTTQQQQLSPQEIAEINRLGPPSGGTMMVVPNEQQYLSQYHQSLINQFQNNPAGFEQWMANQRNMGPLA
jgi:hypothetical protein